jgi:hypothetical protein
MFDRLRPSSAAGCEGAMVRRWSGARVRDLIRLRPFAFSHRPSPIVLTCGGEVLSSHREVRDVRLASPFISGRVRRCYGAKVEWCEGAGSDQASAFRLQPSPIAHRPYLWRRGALESSGGAGCSTGCALHQRPSAKVLWCEGGVVRWCGMHDRLRPSSAAECEGAMVKWCDGAGCSTGFALHQRPGAKVLWCEGGVVPGCGI